MLLQESSAPSGRSPDSVNISDEARRKQMYDQISSNIVSQITRNNPEAKAEENLPEVNGL